MWAQPVRGTRVAALAAEARGEAPGSPGAPPARTVLAGRGGQGPTMTAVVPMYSRGQSFGRSVVASEEGAESSTAVQVARVTAAQALADLAARDSQTGRDPDRRLLAAMESLARHSHEVGRAVPLAGGSLHDSDFAVEDATVEVLVRPPLAQVLPRAAAALALQAAAFWALGAWFAATTTCSTHAELMDACPCPGASLMAMNATYELSQALATRVVLAKVALSLSGNFSSRDAVLLALAQMAVSVGLFGVAAVALVLGPVETYMMGKVADIVVFAWLERRLRGSVFQGRLRPIIWYVVASVVQAALLVSLTRALAAISEGWATAALTSVPATIAVCEFALVHGMRGLGCEGWPAADVSCVTKVMVATFEGLRVGMLVVAVRRDESLFGGAFFAAVLLSTGIEVLARNDLFWTGFRKLACGWSDAQVRARFSLTKECALAARFDAEYAPFLALVQLRLLGYVGTHTTSACDGSPLAVLTDWSWAHLAVMLLAEVAADALSLELSAWIRERRPLLARSLHVELPSSKLMAVVQPMAVVNGAVLGLTGATMMFRAEELL